jgi:DnaJ-class molecular chaperone
MSGNFYEILGVDKNATADEIKKAFRKKSLKMHPDKGGSEAEFQKLTEAYETLSDANKRQQYDNPMPKMGMGGMGMNMGRGGGSGGIPPEFINMMFGGKSGGAAGIPFNVAFSRQGNLNGGNFQFFHNGVRVNPKPAPITHTIEISLEDAYNGKKLPVNIERWVRESDDVRKVEKETIYIDIPKGIDNNEMIVLQNRGNVISENNKGDIKIFIKIKNDTPFQRNGLDLILNKTISLKEALCGFEFEIQYFNNRKFTVKNHNTVIKPGYAKCIETLGLTRGDTTGNLIIGFNIEFPNQIGEKEQEELKKIL